MRQLCLLILSAFMLMAVTCERPVDVVFPEQAPELVLISNFTPGRELQVQVSLSRSIDDPIGADFILNANVTLLEGQQALQQLSLVQEPQTLPFFTTQNFRAEIGNTYTIQVDVPGYERLIARATIPQTIPIKRLSLSDVRATELSDSLRRYDFNFNLGFDDPAEARNYYHLRIFQQFKKFSILRNDTIISDISTRELLFSPELNNNFQVAHYDGGLLMEDTPFDGESKSIDLPLSIEVATSEELPGKIIAELRTTSEPYYLFYSSVSRQRLSPTSLVAEPILIFNHIENGNGVFAAYSQVIDSVAIRDY